MSVTTSAPLESPIHSFHTKNRYGRSVAVSGVPMLKGVNKKRFADETAAVVINKLMIKFSDLLIILYAFYEQQYYINICEIPESGRWVQVFLLI